MGKETGNERYILEQLIGIVGDMRAIQKMYFITRSTGYLKKAKEAEKKVDQFIREINDFLHP
jgi:CHASE3 domain sensor protein